MAFEDTYGEVESTSYAKGYYDESNDDYMEVLRSLLPSGPAWLFEATSNMVDLLTGMSYSFLRVHNRAKKLLEEFDPRTTFELIPDWERVLGLPGTIPVPPTTTAGRREAIHGRLLGHGDPTAAFFEEVADGVGYDVIVKHKEYYPFVPGSVVGAPLTNNDVSAAHTRGGWKFFWRVIAAPGANDSVLTWLIISLTPAHTDGLVVYLGTGWKEQLNPKNVYLASVAHNGSATAGRWCAVGGADGADAYIITSEKFEQYPNHMLWTERSNPKNVALWGITYGNGTWVAVGSADGVDSYILTSPDGITWTERAPTVPKNITLLDVCYSPTLDLFAAVGGADGVDSYILTSSDNGVTWTERAPTVSKNINLRAVTFGGGLFVGVGDADGSNGYILTSPDGSVWTEQDNPQNLQLESVAYGNGLFVAVGRDDTAKPYIITSPDGSVWTQRTPTVTKVLDLFDVTYASDVGLFVAVGENDAADGDSYILTSPDGITWTERAQDVVKNLALYGIGYYNGELVACGVADGTDAYILTSG